MRLANVTTRANSIHGRAIRSATHGWGNHTLILFEFETGEREYYESFWRKDKTTGRTGVRRCAWTNLTEWEAERPTNELRVQWVEYSEQQVQRAYKFCCDSVGKIGYAHLQLWHNLIRWYPQAGSRDINTCSEFGGRVHFAADAMLAVRYILRNGYRTLDMIPPSGRDGLMESVSGITTELAIRRGHAPA